ncbi:MAG TPA: hypothetical protein VGB99_09965 [Acidobacteriota bacterium]
MTDPSTPTGPAPKSGLSAPAWIAIGCGGLIVLVLIVASVLFWYGARKLKGVAEDFEANPAKKAAEMMVRINPELELVRSDDQTITVRLKQTGEEATFDFEQIREGKLRFRSQEGEATLSIEGSKQGGTLTVESDKGTAVLGSGGAERLPAWVPLPETHGELQASYTVAAEGKVGGLVAFASEQSPAELRGFYQERLEAAGYELQLHTLGLGSAGQQEMLIGTHAASERNLTVTITRQEGKTQVMLQYGGKP